MPDFLLVRWKYCEWFFFFQKFEWFTLWVRVDVDRWVKGLIVGFSYTYWNFILCIFFIIQHVVTTDPFFTHFPLTRSLSPVDLNVVFVHISRFAPQSISYFNHEHGCVIYIAKNSNNQPRLWKEENVNALRIQHACWVNKKKHNKRMTKNALAAGATRARQLECYYLWFEKKKWNGFSFIEIAIRRKWRNEVLTAHQTAGYSRKDSF